MIRIKNFRKNPEIHDSWNYGYIIGNDEKDKNYSQTDDFYNMYVAHLGWLIENNKLSKNTFTLTSYHDFIKGYLHAYDESTLSEIKTIINKLKINPIINDSIRTLYFIKNKISPYSHKGLNQNKYYVNLILKVLKNLGYVEKISNNYILLNKGISATIFAKDNVYNKHQFKDIFEYYNNFNI